jgi:hypothetical protein
MGNARTPDIVLASKIAVHFPSSSQFICLYARPYNLMLRSIDVIGTRDVRAVAYRVEKERHELMHV